MKKNVFLSMAIASTMLVACSNDEIVDVNTGSAISFRTLIDNATRANQETTASLSSAPGYMPDRIYQFSAGLCCCKRNGKAGKADYSRTGRLRKRSAEKLPETQGGFPVSGQKQGYGRVPFCKVFLCAVDSRYVA